MAASLNVHLIGGDPWWHQVIGPALIAATAIAAAWIAARTANRRQEAQLRHDRELLTEQLDHDREQRHQQHTREIVNDALGVMDAMIRATSDYKQVVVKFKEVEDLIHAAEGNFPEAGFGAEQRSNLIAERQRRKEVAWDAAVDMASRRLRLAVALGASHAIVTGYGELVDATSEQLKLLDAADPKAIDLAAIEATSRRIRDGSTAFLRACQALSAQGLVRS